MQKLMVPGRLCFRTEGSMWNAYFAKPDTMDGAILMGAIPMMFVADGPHAAERKQAFMDLMKTCFDDFIEGLTGKRSVWDQPITAPEHERSGRA